MPATMACRRFWSAATRPPAARRESSSATHCVTVAVKKGIAREAAVLYPFAETRKALYEGAKRAVAAIPQCKPYVLKLPIQAKKQWLGRDGKLRVKEGVIPDALHIYEF